jgi:hypothetical protein
MNHRRTPACTAAIVVTLLALGLVPAPAAHAAPCDSPANEIVAENCKPGTSPSIWQIPGSGDASIQGFATDISVDQGQTVRFKIDTTASDYRIDIYRLGWYDGSGARNVATVQPSDVRDQGPCATEGSTGLIDCSNWSESGSWAVPQDAVSGIYLAHLVTEGGAQGESHIPFVVRDDDGRSDLLFQTSDTTWQAYNRYGGNSLYTGSPAGRAYKVSYNRPFTTASDADEDWIFNSEFPMIRWLERNGFDVSYFTGVDSDRLGAEIREHRAFLSVGHDEYWSGGQRTNVEAARDAGVNLAFFSGNEVFWKTRWQDGHRTLVCYKETHSDAKLDLTTDIWTGTWRDPRPFNPEGASPENALTGTAFLVNSGTRAIKVPAAEGKLRFWRDTDAAGQGAGGVETLPDGTLGYEWDTDPDNGARPAGLVRLSSTTESNVEILQDYGSDYDFGTATHHLTLYRDTNGAGPDALVLGTGTVQWSWGLDDTHVRGSTPPSPVMQQATTNLFADMGVQPATLQDDLQPATASTDNLPPTATMTSPATISVTADTSQTIQGTATDTGGGVVGAVEVSVDAGVTWHPATGRETWTYTWTPASSGVVTPLARAADDSGNLTGADQSTPPPGGGDPPPGDPPPGDSLPPAGSGGGTGTPGTGTQGTQPGASGRGTGPATSPDVPLTPAVDIITSSVRMSRDGTVRLRISCPRGERDCRVALRLRLDRRTIARRTFTVDRGDAHRVALKLNRATRRKLVRKQSLRVTAVAAVAGGRTTRTTIRLLAPGQR